MPFQSPYDALEIPNVDIWDLLFHYQAEAAARDHVPLIVDETSNASYTASTAEDTALSFATGLERLFSFRKSDVLAVVSENSIHIPPVIWGTLYLGGVVSPMNPAYGVEELRFHLSNSEAKIIVTQEPLLPKVLKAISSAGIPAAEVVLLPEARSCISPFAPRDGIFEFSDLVSERDVQPTKAVIDPEVDNAFLVYSSGTTGLPKGVQLTHRNIVANILMVDVVSSINSRQNDPDVVLAFLPFFHIYGLTVLLHHPFYTRSKIVVMPRFTLAGFVNAIERHRVSVAYVVPPVAMQLLQSAFPSEHDMSSLRYMVSGAAPLAPEITDAVYQGLGLKIIQGYGLTETSPAAFMMSLDEFGSVVGTVGRLLPNQEAKLVDIQDPEVEVSAADAEPGEICIRGPNVFKGYYKNAAATKAAFTRDGFYRTGDVGVIDAESGHLRVTDRIKELIKYKGYQVAPAELEGILLGFEGVTDVCVVGVQDSRLATEVPRAYVVLADGWLHNGNTAAAAEEIRFWLDSRVANHKRLRGGVHFISALPRTASGKILRRELRELAAEGHVSARL